MTSSGEPLGRVVVPRTSFRLGDEVTAIFDCSQCVHPVLQVTASLVYIETVQEVCVVPAANLKPVVTVVSQQTKSCTNSLITHFSLPVPPSLTQSFSDDIGQYNIKKDVLEKFVSLMVWFYLIG